MSIETAGMAAEWPAGEVGTTGGTFGVDDPIPLLFVPAAVDAAEGATGGAPNRLFQSG